MRNRKISLQVGVVGGVKNGLPESFTYDLTQ